ncbi:MAG: hypothetical protein FWG87_10085 [Defluviitaleaceae bacterium]|nr:hypothetical protein [Defluviitaleaceae bacterium]
MDALLDYLDDIEEVLEASKSLPFTNKISVEKDRIMDILNEIRLNLPDDIRSAQRILGDHDRIVAEGERKAAGLVEAAEAEARTRTNNHEIFRRASEQASETLEEAKKDARDLRLNAMDYADTLLKDTEAQLREYIAAAEQQHKNALEFFNKLIDIIYENREQLRGR